MRTVRLHVEGMHCSGCEAIVRHVLEQQPGVQGCTVSHERGEARVAVDNVQGSAKALSDAILAAGYSVRIDDESAE